MEHHTWERHVEGLHKTYRAAKRRSETAGVRKGYRRWVNKVNEEKAVESLVKRASDRLTADPREAEQLATRVVDARPRNVQGWFVRGKARISLTDYGGAASDFLRVTQMQPNHSPGAYLFLALCLLIRSEYEAVLQTLENLSCVFSLQDEGVGEIVTEYRNKALAGRDGERVCARHQDARKHGRPSGGKAMGAGEREILVP
jgi:hypothetical protein